METTTPTVSDHTPGTSGAEPGDGDLVGAILAGDEVAFATLMRRHNRRLFRVCRSVLRNDADAEDALQEAYVAAFLKLDSLEDPDRFGPWLARIAWNESLSRVRRAARRGETAWDFDQDGAPKDVAAQQPGPDQGDTMMARAETRRLLERAIDRLDDLFRPVFIARGIEEMSVAETAALLDIPEQTVRTRYFRGRKALQRILLEDFQVSAGDVFPFGGRRCAGLAERVAERVRAAGGPPFARGAAGD